MSPLLKRLLPYTLLGVCVLFCMVFYHTALAQESETTGDAAEPEQEYTAFLVSPNTENPIRPPVIDGLTEVVIDIVPHSASVGYVTVDMFPYPMGTRKEMHCPAIQRGSDRRWHLICDTLDLSQGMYALRVHAYSSQGDSTGQEVLLKTAGGAEPVFGPIGVFHAIRFTSGVLPSTLEKNDPIAIAFPSTVAGVRFAAVSPDGARYELPLPEKLSMEEGEEIWTTTWDTAYVPSDVYTILASYTTSGGEVFSDTYSSQALLQSSPGTCKERWECADWDACPGTGITRVCVDQQMCNPADEIRFTDTNFEKKDGTACAKKYPFATVFMPSNVVNDGKHMVFIKTYTNNVDAVDLLYSDGKMPYASAGEMTPKGMFWEGQVDGALFYQQQYFFVRMKTHEGLSVLSAPHIVRMPSGDSTSLPSLSKDSDADGIEDETEVVAGFAPYLSDTDADGVGDRVEAQRELASEDISAETAQVLGRSLEKYLHSHPSNEKERNSDIRLVRVMGLPIAQAGSYMVFTGEAAPGAQINVFIDNDEYVSSGQTNVHGNFTLFLNRRLTDGWHEILAAVVSREDGSIIAQSASQQFLTRNGRVVTPDEYGQVDTVSEPGISTQDIVVILLMACIGIFLVFTLIRIQHSREAV